MTERNFEIAEREVAIFCGNELLPRCFLEHAQNSLIEDFPGSDLLPEHLGACDFEIHDYSCDEPKKRSERGSVRSLVRADKAVCEELWSICSDAPSRLLYLESAGKQYVAPLRAGTAAIEEPTCARRR